MGCVWGSRPLTLPLSPPPNSHSNSHHDLLSVMQALPTPASGPLHALFLLPPSGGTRFVPSFHSGLSSDIPWSVTHSSPAVLDPLHLPPPPDSCVKALAPRTLECDCI